MEHKGFTPLSAASAALWAGRGWATVVPRPVPAPPMAAPPVPSMAWQGAAAAELLLWGGQRVAAA
eukprot:6161450-Pyramimonas_sp.AAC.1